MGDDRAYTCCAEQRVHKCFVVKIKAFGRRSERSGDNAAGAGGGRGDYTAHCRVELGDGQRVCGGAAQNFAANGISKGIRGESII